MIDDLHQQDGNNILDLALALAGGPLEERISMVTRVFQLIDSVVPEGEMDVLSSRASVAARVCEMISCAGFGFEKVLDLTELLGGIDDSDEWVFEDRVEMSIRTLETAAHLEDLEAQQRGFVEAMSTPPVIVPRGFLLEHRVRRREDKLFLRNFY